MIVLDAVGLLPASENKKKSHSGNKEEEGMVSESRVSLFVRMNLRVFT
jgi:hypothetical protein